MGSTIVPHYVELHKLSIPSGGYQFVRALPIGKWKQKTPRQTLLRLTGRRPRMFMEAHQ